MKSTPPGGGRDDLGGLGRGLAEVAGDELGAVDLDEVAPGQQAQRLVDAADEAGHGRLPGAGVAGEHEVAGHGGALQPGVDAQLLDAQQGDLPVDLALDALEPDQGVELGRAARRGCARGGAVGCGSARSAGVAAGSRPGQASSAVPLVARGRRHPAADGRRRGADDGQLGGGGDGGVADDAHRRLAELAGRGGRPRPAPRRTPGRAGTAARPARSGSPSGRRASDGPGSRRRRSPGWWRRRRRRAQSEAARGADSATAAARRQRLGPRGVGVDRRRSRPAPPRRRPPRRASRCPTGPTGGCGRAHEASRPAGGWRRPRPTGILVAGGDPAGSGCRPTSRAPPVEAVPNFSARNRP